MKKFWVVVWMLVIVIGSLPLIVAEVQGQNMIQVKGSDSEVNLVQRLAEVFMQKKPGVNIAVTGGGSGTGIAALINKTTDIANSSRDLSPKEEEEQKGRGSTIPNHFCNRWHISGHPPSKSNLQTDT